MKPDDRNITDLLQRDAEKVRGSESFDPRLHQDTMRRIRQAEPGEDRGRSLSWRSLRLAAGLAVAVAVCVLLVLSVPPGSEPRPVDVSESERTPIPLEEDPRPISTFAYRQAFARGEDALLSMLDRDARSVLPQSADIFVTKR